MFGNNQGVPAGVSMLLKTMLPGLDPLVLAARFNQLEAKANGLVSNFDGRLQALEIQGAMQIRLLTRIAALMSPPEGAGSAGPAAPGPAGTE